VALHLHEGTGDEPGWTAWALDRLGFATWAPTREEVLARVPAKLEEDAAWRRGTEHAGGADLGGPTAGGRGGDPTVRIVEELAGDEVLFVADRAPAPPELVDLALRLLDATRADLLGAVEPLPPALLDRDPPYRRFASWATWRTIREVLLHVANTETHYYLPFLGYRSAGAPASAGGDWRVPLARSRAETTAFLRELRGAADLARVTSGPRGDWSARKVLRRLVRHEILHTRSIRRIAADLAG
jgi:hypothetical protein